MAIQIIRKNQQARGEFNGGEILENKPIGFPREGGHLTPYSNLFYWAHAWSDNGSTIPLHPHQGFEILSFVIKGSIEHFDTKLNKWITLEKGAAQIIRAGNGISHSEKINAAGHMFQIWFDPSLEKTMQQDASYNDYSIDELPIKKEEGKETIIYKGAGSPLQMDSPGVEIYSTTFEAGVHELSVEEEKFGSFYIVEGNINIGEEELKQDDYFIVESDAKTMEVIEKTTIFWIVSPTKLAYDTYAERLKNQWQS